MFYSETSQMSQMTSEARNPGRFHLNLYLGYVLSCVSWLYLLYRPFYLRIHFQVSASWTAPKSSEWGWYHHFSILFLNTILSCFYLYKHGWPMAHFVGFEPWSATVCNLAAVLARCHIIRHPLLLLIRNSDKIHLTCTTTYVWNIQCNISMVSVD